MDGLAVGDALAARDGGAAQGTWLNQATRHCAMCAKALMQRKAGKRRKIRPSVAHTYGQHARHMGDTEHA